MINSMPIVVSAMWSRAILIHSMFSAPEVM
jgi:hypothetical protein